MILGKQDKLSQKLGSYFGLVSYKSFVDYYTSTDDTKAKPTYKNLLIQLQYQNLPDNALSKEVIENSDALYSHESITTPELSIK